VTRPGPPSTASPRVATHLHTIYLVRHGQSTWNTERRIQGQTPHVPPTPVGLAQAERVAAALRGCGATALLTSDLLRARQTADVLAPALGLRPRPVSALREQGLGSYEGRLVEDIPRAELDGVATRGPDARPGGGESLREVYDRVGALFGDLVDNGPAAVAVIVSHGDTIRAARGWLQGVPPENVPPDVPPNASITTIRVRDGVAVAAAVSVPYV